MSEEQVMIEEPALNEKVISLDTETNIKPEQEDVVDPGQFEGLRKPEKHEPPVDSPRWNQIYGKMKDFERKLESSEVTLKEKDAIIEEMRKHNQAIMTKFAELSDKSIEKISEVQVSNQKVNQESDIDRINKVIDGLEEQKTQAMSDLDWSRVGRLDKEIRKLEWDVIRLGSIKQENPREQKPKENNPPKQDPVKPHDAVLAFERDNKWFKDDPIMRAAAIAYDFEISKDQKWANDVTGKLAEVKKVIEQRFNYQSEPTEKKTNNKPRVNDVENPTGLRTNEQGKKVYRLSQEELLVCKGLGLTPEDYVKQKMIIGG